MPSGCLKPFTVGMQDWIPDAVWLNLVALSSMDAFRDVCDSVFRNDHSWRQWYDQEAPERAAVPDYEQRLSKFERMCIVKVIIIFPHTPGLSSILQVSNFYQTARSLARQP